MHVQTVRIGAVSAVLRARYMKNIIIGIKVKLCLYCSGSYL